MSVERAKRSILKAITWRVIATTALFLISYFLLQENVKKALSVTVAYHALQSITYFLHERLWSKIGWGKSKGLFIQLTGLSGAGKSTLSSKVAEQLRSEGYPVEVIDGDEYRKQLCSDLGFSKKDRNTNIRRLGFVSSVLARNGVISIIAAINPYEKTRDQLKSLGPNVKTVYIKCELDTLFERDTKDLYRRSQLPNTHPDHVSNLTGVSDPFEEPINPDLTIHTDKLSIEDATLKLKRFIKESV
jgi:adenylylsulfate kinase